MPEECPLEGLITLKVICEAKYVLLVGELEQVKQFRRGFVDSERRRLSVVHKDWDATCSIDQWLLLPRGEEKEAPLGSRRRNQSFFCSLVL